MRALRLQWTCLTLGTLVIVGLLGGSGCRRSEELPGLDPVTSQEPPYTTLFTDVTKTSGVDFTYRNGSETGHSSIIVSLGGGVGVVDFDRDGLMDLCVTGGGMLTPDSRITSLPTELYRNLGNFHFERVGATSGVHLAPHYSHGVSVADYDNDGFSDIMISSYHGVQLWMNQGDGTYQRVDDKAGVDTTLWSTCGVWADFDADGNLDLYVLNYVNWSFENHPECSITGTARGSLNREICSPKEFKPLHDQLFFSNGDGSFREVTDKVGLRDDGKGLGALLADVDNDSDVDIYVANDTTPNFLYLNDGNGQFEEAGFLRGVALDEQGFSNGSMGVDLFDFNLDGLPDIFVANYEDESFALYRNQGNAYFVHVSQPTGITALGELFVGFGSVCADFDRDGDEDVVVANGHVVKYPRAAPRRQVPLYLENNNTRFRRGTFSPDSYFGRDHEGRGLAAADLDNDGNLDLVFSHLNDPISILRNQAQAGSWLAADLTGVSSNRDAVGSRLILQTDRGELVRQIKGGASYLSTNDRRVYWGIPADTVVEKLTIHWPNGKSQEIITPDTGQVLTILEASNDEAG